MPCLGDWRCIPGKDDDGWAVALLYSEVLDTALLLLEGGRGGIMYRQAGKIYSVAPDGGTEEEARWDIDGLYADRARRLCGLRADCTLLRGRWKLAHDSATGTIRVLHEEHGQILVLTVDSVLHARAGVLMGGPGGGFAPTKADGERGDADRVERVGRAADPRRQAAEEVGENVTVRKHSSMGCAMVLFRDHRVREAILSLGAEVEVAGVKVKLQRHIDKASGEEVPTGIFAAWGGKVEKAMPLPEGELTKFFDARYAEVTEAWRAEEESLKQQKLLEEQQRAAAEKRDREEKKKRQEQGRLRQWTLLEEQQRVAAEEREREEQRRRAAEELARRLQQEQRRRAEEELARRRQEEEQALSAKVPCRLAPEPENDISTIPTTPWEQVQLTRGFLEELRNNKDIEKCVPKIKAVARDVEMKVLELRTDPDPQMQALCAKFAHDPELSELAAVVAYTHDFGISSEASLFSELNRALRTRGKGRQGKISIWGAVVRYMLKGLVHFNEFRGTVYRGVPEKATVLEKYKRGRPVQWGAFTSTSVSFDAAKNFMGDLCDGVIFKIECAVGYDLQNVSFYPTEGEILLSPSSRFVVHSEPYEAEGFTCINLIMMADDELVS